MYTVRLSIDVYKRQVGSNEVIPYPHGVENDGCGGDGLHQGEYDAEKYPAYAAAVHNGRFRQLFGYGSHITHREEDCQCRAIAVK